MADDLVQATLALESDLADERRCGTAASARAGPGGGPAARPKPRRRSRGACPRLHAAQETWYGLAALRERVATTMSSPVSGCETPTTTRRGDRPGRDPAATRARGGRIRSADRPEPEVPPPRRRHEARRGPARRRRRRTSGEARLDRDAAGRRRPARGSGPADRAGQLAAQPGRGGGRGDRAADRGARAGRAAGRRRLARLHRPRDDRRRVERGESAWTPATRRRHCAARRHRELPTRPSCDEQEGRARAGRAGRRVEACRGLNRKDASAALLAATEPVDGLLGSVAALSGSSRVRVGGRGGPRAAADAVAVAGLDAAVAAFAHLKAEDLGRAGLLLAGSRAEPHGRLADAARRRRARRSTWSRCRPDVRPAYAGCCARWRWSRTCRPRRRWSPSAGGDRGHPGRRRARRGLRRRRLVRQPSLIEVQAAIEDDRARLAAASHLRAAAVRAGATPGGAREAQQRAEVALARLHESDAAMAALAEELGQLSQAPGPPRRRRTGCGTPSAQAEAARDRNWPGWPSWSTGWNWRPTPTASQPDPAERDRLAEQARLARGGRDGRPAGAAHPRGTGPGPRRPGRRAASGRSAERHAREGAAVRRERLRAKARTSAVGARRRLAAARVETSLAAAAEERAHGRGRPERGGGGTGRGACRGSQARRSSSHWWTPYIVTRWPGPSSGCGSEG